MSRTASTTAVHHRHLELDGHRFFYREAGDPTHPAVVLPHGYPCSSYEFRNFMPALAGRWRLIAPDFPGFGHSDTPEDFDYGFEGYSRWLGRFCDRLGLDRFVLYLHDYGTWISLRLAMAQPRRVAGLIIQNGDIYEDALGPKYEGLLKHFERPTPATRAMLVDAISEEGYKDEFLNGLEGEDASRLAPDLWKLHWGLTTPKRRQVALDLMEALKENMARFPRYQAWLREHQPPALICWGPRDGYMPEESARAWLRDLPAAQLHLLDGSHWLLETHLDEVVQRVDPFLAQVFNA